MTQAIDSLLGKVVVITGAAQGIGKGLAKAFAKADASVVIADIQESAGQKVAHAIHDAGGRAIFVKVDLRKDSDIENMVTMAVEKYESLDILINNARPKLSRGNFLETMNEWNMGIDILLNATALSIKYALPHLLKRPGACILNVSSTNAFFISEQPAVYHVTKAAVIHLTKYLAYEYGSLGIRVNAICPALVDICDDNKQRNIDPVRKALTEAIIPLKKEASVEEIAKAAIFLCSEAAAYITGEILTIDGGVTLGDHFRVARMGYEIAKQNL